MKYTFWFLLLLVCISWMACTGDNDGRITSTYEFAASEDQDTASYVPLYLHEIPEDLSAQVTKLGQYGQIAPPDLTRYEAQVLTKGIWTFEFYVDNNASRAQKIAGTGQWFQFSPDGSFIGGHYQHQTHAGLWYMNYTTEHPTLIIDSNVDNHDAWWQIQGITGQQDAMAWVRQADTGGYGPYRKRIQGKLMELTTLPTKEQFAGQFDF